MSDVNMPRRAFFSWHLSNVHETSHEKRDIMTQEDSEGPDHHANARDDLVIRCLFKDSLDTIIYQRLSSLPCSMTLPGCAG